MLLVILGHAGVPGFDGGYIGVDVFFVISGFLITGGLIREVERTHTVSITGFYARRARRILPAATVTLLAITISYSVLMTAARATKVLGDVVWSAFFAVNIRFSGAGTDYFAEDQFVSPVQHFWSLAVEEQFYLFWPVLILVLCLPGKASASSLDENRGRLLVRRIAMATFVAIIASFLWSVWQTPVNPTAAYFSPLTRSWELGFGAALAIWESRGVGPLNRSPACLTWLGLGLIMYAAIGYSPSTVFPGYAAVVPVVGAVLILFGGLYDKSKLSASLLLDTRPMRYIGDISFSLYLWHWPLLIIPPAYLGRPLDSIEQITAVCFSFCVAALSYKFIELPIRDTPRIKSNRRVSLTLWPISVASILLAVAITGNNYQDSSNPQLLAGEDIGGIVDGANDDQIRQAVMRAASLANAGHDLPVELQPQLEDLFEDVSRPPAGCGAQRDDIDHKVCVLGDKNASRTVVFFGDSHIGMWYDALLPAISERGWKLVTFWKASCFPADITLWRQDKTRPYTECDEFRTWAVEEMRRLQPDKIVLAGLVRNLPADPVRSKPTSNAVGTKLMQTGMVSMLTTLQSISDDVVLLSGTPYLEREPLDCLGTRRADRSTCVIPPDLVTVARNNALQLAASERNASYIDLMPWFCKDQVCPLVNGDIIIYRDTNHVSKTYANKLGEELARRIGL